MIGYLKGNLVEARQGKILIDVNGVGFFVNVSSSTTDNLPAIGNEIKVFTYMSVREDDISLFGFETRDMLDIFLQLIAVSGVGPKGALSILSVFTVPDLKYAIITENATAIAKAPTIGKKTAEKIIIDLKDKMSKEDYLASAGISDAPALEKELQGELKDAVDALVALGYDKKESRKAVLTIENVEKLNSNMILKQALKYMI